MYLILQRCFIETICHGIVSEDNLYLVTKTRCAIYRAFAVIPPVYLDDKFHFSLPVHATI